MPASTTDLSDVPLSTRRASVTEARKSRRRAARTRTTFRGLEERGLVPADKGPAAHDRPDTDGTAPARPAIIPVRPDVHLNLNVRGLGASPTLAINARSLELQASGRRVYRLGLGQSPFPVPPMVVDALRENAHQHDYLEVAGLRLLREAVAAYHRRANGVDRSADDVLVGPGSKELMFLLQLAFYGDVLVPTPGWVSYAPQARILGRSVRWLATCPTEGWKLQPGELEAVCREDPARPRLLILNYPSNPTGLTYSGDELVELAEVARRYGLIILSDEIYGELNHRGEHASMAACYPEGTIVSSGLSKWCGAGGWRLGTFLFPHTLAWLREAMTAIASETYSSVSAPIQFAAVRAFEGGVELDGYLANARRVLAALGTDVARRLREAGADVTDPEGGFYLFPDLGCHKRRLAARGIFTSEELCERLLDDTGVAVLPGTAFGRPPEELTLRLAYVDFDGAAALQAAGALAACEQIDAKFLASHCGNVIEAAEALTGWLPG